MPYLVFKTWTMAKLKTFFYLLGESDGFFNKLKLAAALSLNAFFRPLLRHYSIQPEVKFLSFHLKFKLGQGELAPYEEIKKIKEMISRDLSPFSPIHAWTIIDGGANVGLFSLFFKEAGKIIAIEPHPDCRQRLAYNFKKNRVNGLILNLAVSSSEGSRVLVMDRNMTVFAKIGDRGSLTVQAKTIDQIVSENNLTQVDLLKLDVEGHELSALVGARDSFCKKIIKRIYVEFNNDQALQDLDSHLNPLGYQRKFAANCNALYQDLAL